ncbi:DUF6151 family protein [Haliangium sp.]|uniref:DUF6151 family protein n=1 Tax=Haliangium sp. TaxID=2663208 RepID=UPI003D149BE2
MSQTLEYGCQCGALRGQATDVSPRTGLRLVCYCDDCQAYGLYLAPTTNGAPILDAGGGTEVYQLAPARLTITTGHEHLRCLRLSPKGLLRWYAGCCNTPIANTLPRSFPFVGVPVVALHPAEAREAALGPVRGRVHTRFARPDVPVDGDRRASLGVIIRAVRNILRSWVKRQAKPSPFIRDDGSFAVEPTVLSKEERDAVTPKLS